MNQQIIIEISTDGTARVRTEGFHGSSCINASKFIEQSLGAVERSQCTSDYFNCQSISSNSYQPNENKHE
ncbi:MAG: DUF2997 domain-containing protein [Planctomycetales bacterium]|nr:DUF2997 domain-containing protein [Planctomycetales bacterium]